MAVLDGEEGENIPPKLSCLFMGCFMVGGESTTASSSFSWFSLRELTMFERDGEPVFTGVRAIRRRTLQAELVGDDDESIMTGSDWLLLADRHLRGEKSSSSCRCRFRPRIKTSKGFTNLGDRSMICWMKGLTGRERWKSGDKEEKV